MPGATPGLGAQPGFGPDGSDSATPSTTGGRSWIYADPNGAGNLTIVASGDR